MRCALKKLMILVALVCIAPFFSGCNKDSGSGSPSSSGSGGSGIAMVDPDRVIDAVGWKADVNKNIQQAQTEITQQIKAHLAPSESAFEQKKAEIFAAAKLTPEQIKTINTKPTTRVEMAAMGLTNQQLDDLMASGTVWQAEVNNGRSAMQQAMNRQNAAIQNALRESLFPIIRQVAKDRGRIAVFTPQQAAWFDASVDITDDVVKEIQKRPAAKLTLPDMPRLEWNAGQPTTGPTVSATMPSGPAIAPTIAPAIAPSTQPAPQSKP